MSKPALSILSSGQREKMHQSALRVLEKTGIVVKDEQVIDLLVGAGAHLKGKEQVMLPSSLVEEAMKKAPKKVVIYDREGSDKLILERGNVYFGAHGDCPTILDPLARQKGITS